MSNGELQQRIQQRLVELGAPAAPTLLLDRLDAYFRLLTVWNDKTNLTSLDLQDPAPATIDRLLIEPLLAAQRAPEAPAAIIDIGSGGGSPAIPFALATGARSLRLVESRARKSVFLREALRAVEMPCGEVVTARFEELADRTDLQEAHDLMTVRAVRLDTSVLATLHGLVRPNGQLFLFRSAADEDLELPSSLTSVEAHPLVDDRGRIVVLRKDR